MHALAPNKSKHPNRNGWNVMNCYFLCSVYHLVHKHCIAPFDLSSYEHGEGRFTRLERTLYILYKIYEIEIQIHMKKKTFTHKHTLTILRKYKFIHIYHLLCRLDSNYRLDNSDLIPIEIQHTAAQLKTRKKIARKNFL